MVERTQMSPPNIYSILDATRIFGEPDTAQLLQTNFLSLYMGQSEELISSVAPYLFSYQPESEFGKWLLEKGWGNSWGMYVETQVELDELRKHFRKFLVLKTEEGHEMYFRFFDPRVLRVFLPTCNQNQLIDFFGPIKMFAMENEDADYAIVFEMCDSNLVSTKIPKEEFWITLNQKRIAKPKENIASIVNAISGIKKVQDDTPVENEPEKTEPEIETEKVIEPDNPKPRQWSFMVD